MSLHTLAAQLDDELGITSYVCARPLDDDSGVGLRAGEPVVSASVFKLPVLVDACVRMSTGEISPTERISLGRDDFIVDGGTGLAVFSDPVSLSFRDLCLSMMTVSDNRATDAVMDRLGLDEINARMRGLGLTKTVLEGDCRYLFETVAEDLQQLDPPESYDLATVGPAWLHTRALDPLRTNRTTAAEITGLLAAIWRGQGLSESACLEAKRILGLQVWSHRLRRGFPAEVAVSGKTGTLPYIRNEVGVLEYPTGEAFAVAVFLRTPSPTLLDPRYDDAIADLAAAAVAELRCA